jgi:protein-histidine pros-kinase
VIAVSGVLRAANERLRMSEEKFRGLLESAPDAMVIADAERRIVLVNRRTETLFGYQRTELLGGPVDMLLPERNRTSYATQLAAFRAGSAPAPLDRGLDLHALRKDGREIPIELSLGLLETNNGVLVSHAVRDITAHHQIEARLARASQAKSEFLASVSHELRTPLNAIIGFSELIRDAVIAPLDARYREYGGDINGAGRHLLSIINDILDISKIESGRLELRDELVSIAESIEACHRIVAMMADTAKVSLVVDVPGTLPPIRTDPIRFHQILLNIMSNAVKFTPAGGHVIVSAYVEKDGAVVAIEDTGIGMKPEEIAIALEPFRQIEGALTRRFAGTGLGLPLAKGLVELHGGGLDIQSAPGKGTTVRIRMPAERIASAAA